MGDQGERAWGEVDDERRVRALFEHASDFTVVVDSHGVPLFASPSLSRTLGYSLADLSSSFRTDFVHPDDLEELIAAFERARAERIPASLELRARDRQGGWHVLDATVTHLLHDPDVAGIVINARDVTDRKEAEEALRSKRAPWRLLLENSSELVTVFDADGRMVLATGDSAFLGHDPQKGLDRSGRSSNCTPTTGSAPCGHIPRCSPARAAAAGGHRGFATPMDAGAGSSP